MLLVKNLAHHREVFDDRSQRIGREESQRRDDDDHADQQD